MLCLFPQRQACFQGIVTGSSEVQGTFSDLCRRFVFYQSGVEEGGKCSDKSASFQPHQPGQRPCAASFHPADVNQQRILVDCDSCRFERLVVKICHFCGNTPQIYADTGRLRDSVLLGHEDTLVVVHIHCIRYGVPLSGQSESTLKSCIRSQGFACKPLTRNVCDEIFAGGSGHRFCAWLAIKQALQNEKALKQSVHSRLLLCTGRVQKGHGVDRLWVLRLTESFLVFNPKQAVFKQAFGNLYGVQGCTLANIVRNNPHIEGIGL